MNAALMVIDMQNDFFRKAALKNKRRKLCEGINNLIVSLRKDKVPIVWIRQEFKNDLSDAYLFMKKRNEKITIQGTPGSEVLQEFRVEKGDIQIIKKRWSGFFNTSLEFFLEKNKIDTLIITGINTHACIRMTAIDAYQRDFKVILAKECIASWDEKHHRITLNYLQKGLGIQVLTNNEITKGF